MCSIQTSAACTAVYVGSDVSSDGSVIFARSNDLQEVYGNHITVTPAVDNESGRLMPVSIDGKIKTEIPETTYQYTATPFMNSSIEYIGFGPDAATCSNEYGVAMTMSITAFPNEDALEADPLGKYRPSADEDRN